MEQQELQLLIRSKNLDETTTFQLLDISRYSTTAEIIEGLINLIAHDTEYSELETIIDELKEQIEELRIQNTHLKEEKEQEIEESVLAETFEKFVESFRKENNRYPSIYQTWRACNLLKKN
jgi:CII-binding regulator of phage lambda lysogenization HflD